ncbi:MAG: electron transfer flavoprotein subunit alpha/FixB family protein [Deltaproteobacteria bacterium]|nr:electron transfer flavoprotein subunit alpha/FixB family protein [Deltaproteobacteria bacterium]MBT7890168.1 electron transfer flavoprotein subunit alpha/FixB family protein [Deltaproteobacteria bacterium]
MKKIGLFIETKEGNIKPAVFGMITAARQNNIELVAFLINENANTHQGKLQEFGIKTIVPIQIKNSNNLYHPVHWAKSLITAMKQWKINTLFGLTTARGKTLLPLIAAELGAPLAMNCRSVNLETNCAEKALYSGKTIAKLKLKGTHFIYGMGQNIVEPKSAPCRTNINPFEYSPAEIKNYRYIEEIPGEHDGSDLSEAEVIVSGGRGLANKENFNILSDCARAMRASVGASRAAVDNGWAPYSMQVGQTGFKVSPKLYFAIGLSGSIQHFAGMKTSKLIIAINIDPKAAIVANCDYFIIEDLFDIVPLLTKKLRRL